MCTLQQQLSTVCLVAQLGGGLNTAQLERTIVASVYHANTGGKEMPETYWEKWMSMLPAILKQDP